MTLKEILRKDLTVALKAHDALVVTTLRSVIGALQTAEKGGKTPVQFDDEAVRKLIRTQLKQRKESASEYFKGDRPESAAVELAEAEVLSRYLPVELSDEKLEKLVQDVVSTFENPGSSDFGKVMKQVVTEVAGRADGQRISKLVKASLNV